MRPLASFSILRPFLRRHTPLIGCWLAALLTSSTATLVMPAAVRLMIDHGFSRHGVIDQTFLVLFITATVLALGTATRFYTIHMLSEKVVTDLRQTLYTHLLTLDAPFFQSTQSGELVSRLSTDTELIRSMISLTVSVALRSLVTLVGSMVMLLLTNWQMTVLVLLTIPVAMMPILLGSRRLKAVSRASQDQLADTNAIATETLGMISTVQAYVQEDWESRRYHRALTASLAAAQRRIRVQAWVTACAIWLILGVIIGVLWMGARHVITGQMTAGALGQFVLYALLGGGSMGSLAEVWSELQRAAGGITRIGDLLQQRPRLTCPARPPALSLPVRGQIEFDRVQFHYPNRASTLAINLLDLHITPGQTIALVGPSGAGKSTVLALLLRCYDPTAGVIRLDGIPLDQIDPQTIRQQIAVVAQQPNLFAGTIADNIRYGRPQASDADIQAAAQAAEAAAFIDALPDGYATLLGERGTRLSGGQQQRIAIARALLKQAPILLLDEATSALDAQNEHGVQQALHRLMAGRTTVVIAHRLATVRQADLIVVIDQGRIVAQGTHHQLLTQDGLYRELAQLQFFDANPMA